MKAEVVDKHAWFGRVRVARADYEHDYEHDYELDYEYEHEHEHENWARAASRVRESLESLG